MESLITKTQFKNIDYDKIINYLLVAYAFVLPVSKAGVNVFETLIILTWIIQGNWKHKFALYKNNLLVGSLSALILVSFISIPWAVSTEFALEYIAKYKHFLIILPIYSSLNKEFVKHIFSAFLLGIFLSEVISYGIYFEIWQYKNVLPSDPSPFMGHVDYSVYLSFASILLLSRLFDNEEHSIKMRLIYAVFFLSSTTNLFINGGRTGQVTFIIVIFISIIMNLENKLKGILVSTLLISSILSTSYIYSPNFHNRVHVAKQDVENIFNNNDYTLAIGQRVSLWILGFDNFKDNYMLGKGIGNDMKDIGYYAEKRGFNPVFFERFADNHNTFLIVALQLGIIGLFIILIIFYSILILKFNSNAYKILNLTFIISFVIWSFGNTTFHTMNPMIFFALFAGLFNKMAQKKFLDKEKLKAEDNPISIKYYVKKFFQKEKQRFEGKKVVDFPAGNGITSNIISEVGAIPIPFDLFPEYFNIHGLTCKRANINEGIPVDNEYADAIICQEGIEHFENQLLALREFNRILKPKGSLIVTTPNASNMVGKLSYFLSENELFNRMMPQNELDDIWMSNQEISKEIYYGHIFLIGINKLRLLAKLSGFKIKTIENTRVKTTAIILLVLFYPFIWFSNWRSYRRNLKKNKDFSMETKKEIYGEIFKLATSPRLLLNSHIFIEFEKDYNIDEVKDNLPSKHKGFGVT